MELTLRATRDLNRWLSIEGVYYLAQGLSGNSDGPAPEVASSWTACLAADTLLHLVQEPGSSIDPYLAAGIGFNWYDDAVLDRNIETSMRLGGGVNLRLGDSWLARLDTRFFLPESSLRAVYTVDLGIGLSFGASPSAYSVGRSVPVGGTVWSDNIAPVAPMRVPTAAPGSLYPATLPPTPLVSLPSPAMQSGAVIEPSIRFEAGSARIDPRYFQELDKVAEALRASPNLTAVVEGHSDKTQNSKADYNRQLSLARAQSVVDYLVSAQGIGRDRLTAVGVGFDRPKYPNDPTRGNAANRRIEVHFQGQ
jgi:outer membrane protein OmpA-like peptidoglycan-associated protein